MALNGTSYKEPEGAAKAAGLRYVNDSQPGIARLRSGGGFRYVGPDGKAIKDEKTLERIRKLVIPPAWENVWICTRDDGHLQATGRDARKRKQYRYHARWREVRDETKYGRMLAFSKALSRIRRRVTQDLGLPGLPRNKALATVVRLLETTRIRVGNEEYARENASFGLTTLRTKQVQVRGSTMNFRFRGKSGVHHSVELSDAKVARIVRRMRDLPGYELFQYVDEGGETRAVDSGDVNEYLKEISGEEFTSKDFRTWAGTVLAAEALRELDPPVNKRQLTQAIESVARQLGNTPAVCRKCYIHPAVIDTCMAGRLVAAMNGARLERAVQRLLHQAGRKKPESLVPALRQSLHRLRRRGTPLAGSTVSRIH